MSEKKGHFEKGRWIPEPEPGEAAAGSPDEGTGGKTTTHAPDAERLIGDASRSVQKALDDVVNAGRHLFGTPEGRQHIEKKVRKAGEDLEHAIDDMAEAARKALEKRKS